jgi:acyl carrier protein
VQVDQLEQAIIDFIREQIAASADLQIDPEDNLFTGGHVDSLGIMRLIAHLERTLEIDIPLIERVPDNFRSVRVMADYLSGKLENRA